MKTEILPMVKWLMSVQLPIVMPLGTHPVIITATSSDGAITNTTFKVKCYF
ncbi:MAG: hypothetical protein IPK14_27935 [Blastocatellia bacterium]|nr:hypothetical protein [Blastocatellia bacterium]